MKLKINHSLRQALYGAMITAVAPVATMSTTTLSAAAIVCVLAAPQASAADIDINVSNSSLWSTGTAEDTIFADISPGYIGYGFTTTAGTLVLFEMSLNNGFSNQTYTFDSVVRDATKEELNTKYALGKTAAELASMSKADVDALAAAKGYTGSINTNFTVSNQNYIFTKDMSGFSGDIMTSTTGQLNLKFTGDTRTGAALDAVSGTGEINLQDKEAAVTYDIAGQSTVKNTSITSKTITFNATAGSSTYTVSSDMNAKTGITLGANAHVKTAGSASVVTPNLTVGTGGSFTVSTGTSLSLSTSTGSVKMEGGSTLKLTSGATMDSLTLLGGKALLDIVLSSTTPSLTLGDFANAGALATESAFDFNINYSSLLVSGDSFTLISGVTDSTLFGNLDAATLKFYDSNGILDENVTGVLSVDANGNLIVTVETTNVVLDWAAGDGTWSTGTAGFNGKDFVAGSDVRFLGGNATTPAASTVTLGSDVAAGVVTIAAYADITLDTGYYIFSAEQIAIGTESSLTLAQTLSSGNVSMYVSGDASASLTLTANASGSNIILNGGHGANYQGQLTIAAGVATMSLSEFTSLSALNLAAGSSFSVNDKITTNDLDLTKVSGAGELVLSLQGELYDWGGSGTYVSVKLSDGFTGDLRLTSGLLDAQDSTLVGVKTLVLQNAGIVFRRNVTIAKDIQVADNSTAYFRAYGGAGNAFVSGAITGDATTTIAQTDLGHITLNDISAFKGTISVRGGSLTIAGGTDASAPMKADIKAIDVRGGKTLNLGANTDITVGTLAGSDQAITLGDNANLNVGGKLSVNSAVTLGTGSKINLLDNATLLFNGTSTTTAGSSIVVSHGASIVSNTGASLTLAGNIVSAEGSATSDLLTMSGNMKIYGNINLVGDLVFTDGTINLGVGDKSALTIAADSIQLNAGATLVVSHQGHNGTDKFNTDLILNGGTLSLFDMGNKGRPGHENAGDSIAFKALNVIADSKILLNDYNGGFTFDTLSGNANLRIEANAGEANHVRFNGVTDYHGTLNYTGNASLSSLIFAGTISQSSGKHMTVTGGHAVNADGNLRFTGQGGATFDSVIQDNGATVGSLNIAGGFDLKLNANNTYSGNTVITGDLVNDATTVTAGNNGAFGTGAVTATGNADVIIKNGVTIANSVTVSAGADLIVKGTDTTSNKITVSTKTGIATSTATLSGISAGSITSATLSNATLNLAGATTVTTLDLSNGATLAAIGGNATLTATDVIIAASVADGTLTITEGVVSPLGDITSTNLSISSLGDVSTIINGSLILNIELTADEYAAFTSLNEFLTFTVDGLKSLDGVDLSTITINLGDGTDSTQFNPADFYINSAGDVTFTSSASVPEPSTAVLSLLALAGLAARRRRKQA